MAPTGYRLTGRISDQSHHAVEGLVVRAFSRAPRILMRDDSSLGTSRTASDGSFEIAFSDEAFKGWLERKPSVYVEIRDREGNPLLTTSSKENDTGRIDMQIELGVRRGDPGQPDIYSGGVARMIGQLKAAGDFADVSQGDVGVLLDLLLRMIGSYTLYTDEIVALSGYDGIQVPGQPRREDHLHVIRWDEVVLP